MTEKQTYTLIVNGQERTVSAKPNTFLMDVLRDDLRLTGVKDGCSTGHCGSCTVIKDGEAVRSCITQMKRSDGANITTIEGLTAEAAAETANSQISSSAYSPIRPSANSQIPLHPIQQAYIDQGATQCGFCTPGFIMATKALLDKNPNPSLQEIYDGHRWNICRCTGHNAIIRAVQQAAGQDTPPLPAVKSTLKAISRPLPRPDAAAKVTGAGKYADDLYVEGMLYARALRSDYPHARLLNVDVSRARELPGVVAVLTSDDIPGRKISGVHELDWPVLCFDKVRYVGDALALVAAESEEIAAEALKLIEVEYEPLPVVAGPKEAAAEGAPIVHPEHETGNLFEHYHLDQGGLEAGFAEADVIVEREYTTQTVEHGFIEPEAGLAVPGADGRITVYCGGQIPFSDREQM